jgi:hypothetical protein
MKASPPEWFAVRCLFRHEAPDGAPNPLYEERITLWRAASFDEAIALAESDAAEYATNVEADYLGLAQAYWTDDEPRHGAELFSLMRSSDLPASEYLNRYFDDGNERQQSD